MRLVLQRVTQAEVLVAHQIVARIGRGTVVLVGFARSDTDATLARAAHHVLNLRIFADDRGKMNRSALEVGASFLIVPEFTLVADVSQGLRPDFGPALPAPEASRLFEAFVAQLTQSGLTVAQGQFQAHMLVSLANDGPVTFIVDA